MVDYPVEEENLNIRSMNSEGKNGLKNVISWGYISAGLRSSPVGSGGGGVARAHIPERLLVTEPSLKLVINRSTRLKKTNLLTRLLTLTSAQRRDN